MQVILTHYIMEVTLFPNIIGGLNERFYIPLCYSSFCLFVSLARNVMNESIRDLV